MMQLPLIDTGNQVIPAPLIAESVRSGYHQAVQDGKKDRPLNIEFELPLSQKLPDHRLNAGFPPQALKNQNRPDRAGIRRNIALAGKNQRRVFGKPGKRTDQGFNPALFLKMIQSAKSCNDPLANFAGFLSISGDLQVLVLAGFFDSCKHGGSFQKAPQIYMAIIAIASFSGEFIGITFSRFPGPRVNNFK